VTNLLRRIVRGFAAVTIVVVLTLASRTPILAQEQGSATIRVGLAPSETFAQVFYAKDLGLFDRAHLNVEVSILAPPSTIAAAVLSGTLDIGGASTLLIANTHSRGLPLFLVAPGGVYSTDSPTTALIVAKSSTIRHAKDLAGKTIAVTLLKDIAQDSVMAWIDRNGGDATKSHFIELPVSAMVAAVTSGRVDAAFVPEPNLSQGSADTRYLASAFDGLAKHFILITWFASGPWLDKNLETAKKFAAIMREAGTWAMRHPDLSAEILARYTKLPIATVNAMRRTTYVDTLDPSLIQPVIDAGVRYKTFDKTFPASELIYPGLR
jgi:NitT/TauT family transport system substrate-binding protein